MKRTFLFRKTLILLIIFPPLHLILHFNRISIDGLKPEIYCLLNGEDTRYSQGFSQRKFRQIRPGMTEKNVLRLLGEPIQRFSYDSSFKRKTFELGHYLGLKYSESPSDDNYRIRVVHFENGKVVRVIGKVWFD